ncbi:MAG: hypothetical protein KKD73_04675 [Proteobacteria bacterium]|nr:hypothetical protein [Pseudomonadota bacterium]MBU1641445.1 hypothetical protein [Pseudomonadota bacterium]
MRCPKCSYISFDKVTSCGKCSADVTEVAHTLNGTAFKPLGTFYLGTLIPDYADAFGINQVAEDFSFDNGADDLDISMDAIGDFGEVPDLPGDISEDQYSFAADDVPEYEGDELSLEGHAIPDMDLSSFGEGTGFNVGTKPVEEPHFDDVPEFDLAGIEFEEDADVDMAAATPDLSDIDLSLGEDEMSMAGDDEEMVDLADLDMEMEVEHTKDSGPAELPDLEL